jgi:hypothetical protein
MKGTIKSYAFTSVENEEKVIAEWNALREKYKDFNAQHIATVRGYNHNIHRYQVNSQMAEIGYDNAAYLLIGHQPFGGSWQVEGDVMIIRESTD